MKKKLRKNLWKKKTLDYFEKTSPSALKITFE